MVERQGMMERSEGEPLSNQIPQKMDFFSHHPWRWTQFIIQFIIWRWSQILIDKQKPNCPVFVVLKGPWNCASAFRMWSCWWEPARLSGRRGTWPRRKLPWRRVRLRSQGGGLPVQEHRDHHLDSWRDGWSWVGHHGEPRRWLLVQALQAGTWREAGFDWGVFPGNSSPVCRRLPLDPVWTGKGQQDSNPGPKNEKRHVPSRIPMVSEPNPSLRWSLRRFSGCGQWL